jgi:hypothetical protein
MLQNSRKKMALINQDILSVGSNQIKIFVPKTKVHEKVVTLEGFEL